MDAENKFWRSLDLMLQLLPFLDVASTLALVSAHTLARDLLCRISTWKKFLERTRLTQERLVACTTLEQYCDEMVDMGEEMDNVHTLLFVMDPKNLRPDLDLTVLQTICRRFPGATKGIPSAHLLGPRTVNNSITLQFHEGEENTEEGSPVCFSVSSEGLGLIRILDLCDYFTVVEAHMEDMSELHSNTLCEIVELQEKPIMFLDAHQVDLESESMALLMDRCKVWQVQILAIPNHFSGEDWARLAKRVKETKPEESSFNFLGIEDWDSCRRGSREDLGLIWAAAKLGWMYKMKEGDTVAEGLAMMENGGWAEE